MVGPNSATKTRQTPAVPAPVPTELWKDGAGHWAPADHCYDSEQAMWKMDMLRGQHTAVVLRNAQNLTIGPNNPINGIPGWDGPGADTNVWIDPTPSSARRPVFFYGRRFPGESAEVGNDQCVLIQRFDGGVAGRTFLQVWVRDYKNRNVFIRLFGPSISLNSPDIRAYQLQKNLSIRNDESASSAVRPGQIMTQVLHEIDKMGGTINHLVINCHGGNGADGCFVRLGHDYEYFASHPRPGGGERYNIGFSKHNVDLWARLQGKVRYIWFQACAVGGDNQLCSAIADRSKAWVTAPEQYTATAPRGLPAGHIEYLYGFLLKHWNGNVPQDPSGKPSPSEPLFRSARFATGADLDKSLYFNITQAH
jgi:hypothetical protein